MERHELYGWVDFIANSGGLVGFFMGCSMVSLFEMIYFVLLLRSKKNNKQVNFNKTPKKKTNKMKNSKFIQVSSVSVKKMPRFEYLP